MVCEHCDIINGEGKAEVLYRDKEIVVAIRDMGITPGQITIFPIEHFTIMELVPDDILEKCAIMANKVSVTVFEGLGAVGTNVVVNNGLSAGQKTPHFAIEVVPRQENDGLNLQWESKQLMEDELELVFLALTGEEKEPKKEKKKESKGEPKKIEDEEDKENYLIKSIKRLP